MSQHLPLFAYTRLNWVSVPHNHKRLTSTFIAPEVINSWYLCHHFLPSIPMIGIFSKSQHSFSWKLNLTAESILAQNSRQLFISTSAWILLHIYQGLGVWLCCLLDGTKVTSALLLPPGTSIPQVLVDIASLCFFVHWRSTLANELIPSWVCLFMFSALSSDYVSEFLTMAATIITQLGLFP